VNIKQEEDHVEAGDDEKFLWHNANTSVPK
jgi:hypothetical protein